MEVLAEEKVSPIIRLPQRKIVKLRAELRAISPLCHWCGCMTLPTRPAPFHPDMETVDHIKPKRQCLSAEEYHAETNRVLACMECNLARDRVDIAMLKHQREEAAKIDRLRKPARRALVRFARGQK